MSTDHEVKFTVKAALTGLDTVKAQIDAIRKETVNIGVNLTISDQGNPVNSLKAQIDAIKDILPSLQTELNNFGEGISFSGFEAAIETQTKKLGEMSDLIKKFEAQTKAATSAIEKSQKAFKSAQTNLTSNTSNTTFSRNLGKNPQNTTFTRISNAASNTTQPQPQPQPKPQPKPQTTPNQNPNQNQASQTQFQQFQAQLTQLQTQNQTLQTQNQALQSQLAQLQAQVQAQARAKSKTKTAKTPPPAQTQAQTQAQATQTPPPAQAQAQSQTQSQPPPQAQTQSQTQTQGGQGGGPTGNGPTGGQGNQGGRGGRGSGSSGGQGGGGGGPTGSGPAGKGPRSRNINPSSLKAISYINRTLNNPNMNLNGEALSSASAQGMDAFRELLASQADTRGLKVRDLINIRKQQASEQLNFLKTKKLTPTSSSTLINRVKDLEIEQAMLQNVGFSDKKAFELAKRIKDLRDANQDDLADEYEAQYTKNLGKNGAKRLKNALGYLNRLEIIEDKQKDRFGDDLIAQKTAAASQMARRLQSSEADEVYGSLGKIHKEQGFAGLRETMLKRKDELGISLDDQIAIRKNEINNTKLDSNLTFNSALYRQASEFLNIKATQGRDAALQHLDALKQQPGFDKKDFGRMLGKLGKASDKKTVDSLAHELENLDRVKVDNSDAYGIAQKFHKLQSKGQQTLADEFLKRELEKNDKIQSQDVMGHVDQIRASQKYDPNAFQGTAAKELKELENRKNNIEKQIKDSSGWKKGFGFLSVNQLKNLNKTLATVDQQIEFLNRSSDPDNYRVAYNYAKVAQQHGTEHATRQFQEHFDRIGEDRLNELINKATKDLVADQNKSSRLASSDLPNQEHLAKAIKSLAVKESNNLVLTANPKDYGGMDALKAYAQHTTGEKPTVNPRGALDPRRWATNLSDRATLLQVLLSSLGSLPAGAGAIIGGAIGGTGGSTTGAMIGNALEVPIHMFMEAVHMFKEAGLVFNRSVLGIAAINQQNTEFVSKETGKPLALADQITLQQRKATEIQLKARSKLLPLGIAGQTEATFVQGIASALSQRGFSANADQIAEIAQYIGATIQAQRPQLLDNPTLLLRDLQDVLGGGPSATRVLLTQLLGRNAAVGIQKARNTEDIRQSLKSAGLGGQVEALQNSSNIQTSVQKIQGALDQFITKGGTKFLEMVADSVKKFSDALVKDSERGGEISEYAERLGSVLGVLTEALIKYVPALVKLLEEYVPQLIGMIAGASLAGRVAGTVGTLGTALSMAGVTPAVKVAGLGLSVAAPLITGGGAVLGAMAGKATADWSASQVNKLQASREEEARKKRIREEELAEGSVARQKTSAFLGGLVNSLGASEDYNRFLEQRRKSPFSRLRDTRKAVADLEEKAKKENPDAIASPQAIFLYDKYMEALTDAQKENFEPFMTSAGTTSETAKLAMAKAQQSTEQSSINYELRSLAAAKKQIGPQAMRFLFGESPEGASQVNTLKDSIKTNKKELEKQKEELEKTLDADEQKFYQKKIKTLQEEIDKQEKELNNIVGGDFSGITNKVKELVEEYNERMKEVIEKQARLRYEQFVTAMDEAALKGTKAKDSIVGISKGDERAKRKIDESVVKTSLGLINAQIDALNKENRFMGFDRITGTYYKGPKPTTTEDQLTAQAESIRIDDVARRLKENLTEGKRLDFQEKQWQDEKFKADRAASRASEDLEYGLKTEYNTRKLLNIELQLSVNALKEFRAQARLRDLGRVSSNLSLGKQVLELEKVFPEAVGLRSLLSQRAQAALNNPRVESQLQYDILEEQLKAAQRAEQAAPLTEQEQEAKLQQSIESNVKATDNLTRTLEDLAMAYKDAKKASDSFTTINEVPNPPTFIVQVEVPPIPPAPENPELNKAELAAQKLATAIENGTLSQDQLNNTLKEVIETWQKQYKMGEYADKPAKKVPRWFNKEDVDQSFKRQAEIQNEKAELEKRNKQLRNNKLFPMFHWMDEKEADQNDKKIKQLEKEEKGITNFLSKLPPQVLAFFLQKAKLEELSSARIEEVNKGTDPVALKRRRVLEAIYVREKKKYDELLANSELDSDEVTVSEARANSSNLSKIKKETDKPIPPKKKVDQTVLPKKEESNSTPVPNKPPIPPKKEEATPLPSKPTIPSNKEEPSTPAQSPTKKDEDKTPVLPAQDSLKEAIQKNTLALDQLREKLTKCSESCCCCCCKDNAAAGKPSGGGGNNSTNSSNSGTTLAGSASASGFSGSGSSPGTANGSNINENSESSDYTGPGLYLNPKDPKYVKRYVESKAPLTQRQIELDRRFEEGIRRFEMAHPRKWPLIPDSGLDDETRKKIEKARKTQKLPELKSASDTAQEAGISMSPVLAVPSPEEVEKANKALRLNLSGSVPAPIDLTGDLTEIMGNKEAAKRILLTQDVAEVLKDKKAPPFKASTKTVPASLDLSTLLPLQDETVPAPIDLTGDLTEVLKNRKAALAKATPVPLPIPKNFKDLKPGQWFMNSNSGSQLYTPQRSHNFYDNPDSLILRDLSGDDEQKPSDWYTSTPSPITGESPLDKFYRRHPDVPRPKKDSPDEGKTKESAANSGQNKSLPPAPAQDQEKIAELKSQMSDLEIQSQAARMMADRLEKSNPALAKQKREMADQLLEQRSKLNKQILGLGKQKTANQGNTQGLWTSQTPETDSKETELEKGKGSIGDLTDYDNLTQEMSSEDIRKKEKNRKANLDRIMAARKFEDPFNPEWRKADLKRKQEEDAEWEKAFKPINNIPIQAPSTGTDKTSTKGAKNKDNKDSSTNKGAESAESDSGEGTNKESTTDKGASFEQKILASLDKIEQALASSAQTENFYNALQKGFGGPT